MRKRACFDIPDHICLGDDIFALGGVTIGGKSNRSILCRRRAICKDVQIEFIVIAIEHGTAEIEV